MEGSPVGLVIWPHKLVVEDQIRLHAQHRLDHDVPDPHEDLVRVHALHLEDKEKFGHFQGLAGEQGGSGVSVGEVPRGFRRAEARRAVALKTSDAFDKLL